jgi:hypothetical protein
MINLKYFNPSIDHKSLMESYEDEYIKKVKGVFGITDFWASYSWGFSDKRESEDRDFLLKRIKNFKNNNIKLHAYIQGTNLVYEDFEDEDWFCRDNKGSLIPYHRGRKMTCVNNPGFVNYILSKIEKTFSFGFDGIYMDNIYNGLPPLPIFDKDIPLTFAGCACDYCKEKFRKETGQEIPTDLNKDVVLTKRYLDFRVNSTSEFIKQTSLMVHKGRMEFGTNSQNPDLSGNLFYGYDISELKSLQDYLLFEAISFPKDEQKEIFRKVGNIASKFSKPVFLVSYKEHIGLDKEYSNEDFELLFAESKKHNISLCIKGCEYLTNGKWHNLRVGELNKPFSIVHKTHKHVAAHMINPTIETLAKLPIISQFIKNYYTSILTLIAERKTVRNLFNILLRF